MQILIHYESIILLITLTILIRKINKYLQNKGIYTIMESKQIRSKWIHKAKTPAELHAYINSEEYTEQMYKVIKDSFIMAGISIFFITIMNFYPVLITANNTKIYWYYPFLLILLYKIIKWLLNKVRKHGKNKN